MFKNIAESTQGSAIFDIIVILLVAFLLGLLLGWILWRRSKQGDESDEWKSRYEGANSKIARLEEDLSSWRNRSGTLQRDLDECRKSISMAAAAPSVSTQKDDLTKIEGIGPKVQGLLYNAEIFSWQQLSMTKAEKIRGILDAAGGIYKQRNPDTWPSQAAMAHEGKWDELKKWQDEHDHGLI